MDTEAVLGAMREASSPGEEGGSSHPALTGEELTRIALAFGLTPRQASALALENGLLPLRYARNIGTVGLVGQARLLRSKAAVIGAGGLGGRAAELLARSGVGSIVLVDPDVFDETNLNRQAFCSDDTLGLYKVDVAKERLSAINPDVEVAAHRAAVDAGNLSEFIKGCDVVVDALDSIDDRLALQEACRSEGVVMVHGAIAGALLQVTTVFPGDRGLAGIMEPGRGGKARGIETETGNLPTTATLAAAIQVQEALKVILGWGEPLRNRMLYLDLEDMSFVLADIS